VPGNDERESPCAEALLDRAPGQIEARTGAIELVHEDDPRHGVRVGQPLEVRNSDPLLHNVRADSAVNEPFNQGQPVQGMRYAHTFSTAEVMVPMKCDVHAWMNAWIGVVNHPYFAVTGADGAFTLANLPPGSYTVEAWHEAAGTQSGTVTVTAHGTASLSLTFKAPTT